MIRVKDVFGGVFYRGGSLLFLVEGGVLDSPGSFMFSVSLRKPLVCNWLTLFSMGLYAPGLEWSRGTGVRDWVGELTSHQVWLI